MSTAKRDAGKPTPGDAPKVPSAGDQKSADAGKPPGVPVAKTSAPSSGSVKALPPRRRFPIGLIVAPILLVIVGGGLWAWYRANHPVEPADKLVLQGNVDVRQVNLAFKVDGRIATLAVDEGDTVEAGQVIATLEGSYFDDDLRAAKARRDNAAANVARLEHGSRPEEIAAAKAQVAEQKAALARSQQDFDRAERLVGSGAVSRETFDQSKAALDEAQARLKYSEENERIAVIGPRQEDIDAGRAQLLAEEAAVVKSERRETDSKLIAPSAGMILTRAREKGAIVAPGETVFTLTLSSPVWIRTYVNEQDLGRIHPGMAGVVTTDSAPDKKYPGQIGFISPAAEFTPKTVETRELRTNLVYRLRFVVDNPDNGLRQGMPVTVTLDLDARK